MYDDCKCNNFYSFVTTGEQTFNYTFHQPHDVYVDTFENRELKTAKNKYGKTEEEWPKQRNRIDKTISDGISVHSP